MSRPPLSYPLTRVADGDAGGIADLQTDVMRFMAILAICLVAIFALVQSIPLDSEPPQVTTEEPAPEPPPAAVPDPEVVVVTRPVQVPVERPMPTRTPEPAKAPPASEATPSVEAPAQEGFTLQFESDLALTRLTARNDVALYAIGEDKSLRMSINRGRMTFWPASTPNEFHEMEAATVPEDVRAALRISLPNEVDAVTWGVTLPNRMQEQLNNFLKTEKGGSLLIGADGSLRLE